MTETMYVVVPCYNEQEMLPITTKKLREKMLRLIGDGKISANSKVMYVDDGSSDLTWEYIEKIHSADDMFVGLKLSRNKGHQNALLAGLMTAKERADIVVSMDADLQDDLDAIDGFLEKRQQGCDIVYGVRNSRKKDSFFKRATAQCFYKFMKTLGVDILYNHADYRMMSKKALNALETFSEVNLFLRGIVPMIGYKTDTVTYERGKRTAGESKYPLKKMVAFALEGITSLSVKPIRLITSLGVLVFAISAIMLIYFIALYFSGKTIQGWSTITISIWAIGGLQLLAIGIIGEYIGKIYLETKKRPKYIVEYDLEK